MSGEPPSVSTLIGHAICQSCGNWSILTPNWLVTQRYGHEAVGLWEGVYVTHSVFYFPPITSAFSNLAQQMMQSGPTIRPGSVATKAGRDAYHSDPVCGLFRCRGPVAIQSFNCPLNQIPRCCRLLAGLPPDSHFKDHPDCLQFA